MKEKKLETLLYSTVGVAVMFIIIVAVNLIASALKTRVDLTEGKIYTLSPGTKAILKKIDAPVEVRFYYSQGQERVPSQFKAYAKQVEDLLGEFRQYSGGNLEIKKLDPEPDSDAEDLANLDGVEGQMLQTGDKFYLGIAISLDPQKVALPFLPLGRERMLEYDLARAISQILSTNKPVIGVMTPLQVFGMQMPPQMRMQMGGQNQEPWAFISELKRDFEVRQVPMETEKIDDDIKVLMVVHPKDIKDSALYAIDQFVMRGGKLIAALDPLCLADAQKQNPMMPMPGGSSNLERLLKAWGLTFDATKVAADRTFARQLMLRQGGQPEVVPTLLFLTEAGITKEDVVAAQVDEILLPFAGVFTGTPASGLKQSILLKTSKKSQLVEPFLAQMSPSKIMEDFKESDTSYSLAVRLEGKFKSAFPEGKPKADAAGDAKPADAGDSLKESKVDNAVVLIGDTDWLSDQFSVQVQNFFGQRIVQPRNGNLTLTQNVVEQLAGDQNLIGVRSRSTINRPLTKMLEMQAAAGREFQDVLKNLEAKKQEAQGKISALQSKKDAGQRLGLSPEQAAEVKKFRAEEAAANRELKEVKKKLKRKTDQTETVTKVINIALMPFLVAAAGVGLAVVRKQKTKAK